jgi:hypothetical protein
MKELGIINKRHSWIKFTSVKSRCTRCGIVKQFHCATKETKQVWKYYYEGMGATEFDNMPKCK